jgi:hypothetical protein
MQSMRTTFFCVLLLIGLLCENVFSQSIQSTNYDGGSVVTELSPKIKLNEKSSLRRSWIVLNGSSCPVQLNKAGIKTAYGYWGGTEQYWFSLDGGANIKQKIQAVEITCMLFDIFGEHLRTLSLTAVEDVETTDSYKLGGRWLAGENDVSHFLTSVVFVTSVRTSEGKIWRFDQKAVFDELARTQLKAADIEINPSKEK